MVRFTQNKIVKMVTANQNSDYLLGTDMTLIWHYLQFLPGLAVGISPTHGPGFCLTWFDGRPINITIEPQLHVLGM